MHTQHRERKRDGSKWLRPAGALTFPFSFFFVFFFLAHVQLPYTVNIPWIPRVTNDTLKELGIYDPCDALTVHERTTRGCLQPPTNNAIPSKYNFTKDDFVCFGVRPSRNQDNQVEEDWTIATEPEDPVFYSTCFSLVPAGGFLDVPPLVQQEVPWATGDACLACEFHDALRQLNDSQVPYWEGAKFTAKVREFKTNDSTVLLKTNMGAGHGGASGRYDRLKEVAFDYAYALTQVGIEK